MQKLLRLALIAAAIVFASVSARAFTAAINDIEWKVFEIGGKKVDDAGSLVFHQNKVAGRAACNKLFGQFAPTATGVAFNHIGTTRMACEGKMELEAALLSALEKVRAFKHDGLTLLLLDDSGATLVKLVQ